MKIEEAVEQAYEAGMAIKRSSASTDVIIEKSQSPRISFLKTCNGRMYAPSREDLIADDWEVVEHSADRSRWNPMEWVEYLRYETEVDAGLNSIAASELKKLNELFELHKRNENNTKFGDRIITIKEFREQKTAEALQKELEEIAINSRMKLSLFMQVLSFVLSQTALIILAVRLWR